MTRRDLSGSIGSVCLFIVVMVAVIVGVNIAFDQLYSRIFPEVEAQESTELSAEFEFNDPIWIVHPIYRSGDLWIERGDTFEQIRIYPESQEPEEEITGIWEITGNLRQAIIDTVKAVLARELKVLFYLPDSFSVEVEFTNGIPICPYCRVGTKRIEHSPLMDSNISLDLIYELPQYDENGELCPKRKPNYWGEWECLKCGKHYTVEGNSIDGWRYK